MDVSAKAAHSGEREAAGGNVPPRPHSPHIAAHTAKQGRIDGGVNDREKMASSLSTAYQNPAGCRVYIRAAPGFFSLPFGPRAVQSGCGRQPAKSVWLPTASQTLCLPHPRVGKTCFPPTVQVLTVPVLSALQGGFGVILLTFASSVHPLILASRQPWRLRYNVLTLRLWCGRRTTPSASSSPHTAAHRPSRAGLGYRRLLTCRDV